MFNTVKIHKGETISLEHILEQLIENGYKRGRAVTEEGDVARRGSVIDIFPLGYQHPLRIDCFALEGQSETRDPVACERVNFIRSFRIEDGMLIDEHMAVIILSVKGIKRKAIRKRIAGPADFPISSFVDITPGDLTVHIKHGIGIYRGVEHVKVKGRFREHFVIEYAGGEKIYLHSDSIDLIQKYIGIEGSRPKLHKLGGAAWSKECRKAQASTFEMAGDMLKLQARREMSRGFAFSPDKEWQIMIEKMFPYRETPDQERAIRDVKEDMQKPHPMDRLICGDVGYGKTEVALRASVKTVLDNKQVAVLVPTTLLAEQHYGTFRERLKDYPFNIEMLSRFVSKKTQRKIVESLKKGNVDIVIGTHRLLGKDIAFKDLGLVLIDEEQRFGVRSKESLKKMRFSVDVLTLTATPIPRTLYLAMMGARDISTINTPPTNRSPIQTKVAEFSEEIIRKAIKKELSRDGQVFFIHNRIKDIHAIASCIKRLLPELRLGLAHGRMPSRALEKTVIDFIRRKSDLLVCTNIIESGIDIPNVNTIIINNADHFGLADLYQLRGRVGRLDRKAHCYLLYAKKRFLENDARRRLELIEQHTDLGSGFRIAMEDLSMRGAGSLLGIKQHGFINSVGFDLYCRLLKGAIHRLRGNDPVGAAT